MMAIAVEGLVGDQALKGEAVDERGNADRIETMAGQKDEAHEIAERVGEREDFGRHAAFGAADGLALSPPFAPWPWRWTLTMVASTMAYSMSGCSETGLEKPDENIGFDPIAIALEDSVPVAEKGRKIPPRASRPHDPEHRFDKAAVVAPASSRVRRLAQTMRFHLRPLGVRQHKSFHPKLESRHHGANAPSAGLTSDQPDDNNPLDRFEIEDGTWRKATSCRRWSTSGPRLPA